MKNNFNNLKKNALRNEIKRKYGSKAFKRNKDIKLAYLRLMMKNADEKTKKRIVLAMNFRKMRHKKRLRK